MKFQGSKNYVATQDLMLAVNAAITLQRPLLVKGEPGTGKTQLAEEIARALVSAGTLVGLDRLRWRRERGFCACAHPARTRRPTRSQP